MANKVIFVIIGAVIGAAVLYFFFWPDIEERTVITYKTETITVYDTTDVTNIIDSIRWKEEIVYREVSLEPEKYDSIRTYSGFEKHLYGRINWTVRTGGYLHYMELNPVLNIPIQTVTNTIEKTITRTINTKGLYATGGISSDFKYKIGATFINDRSLLGVKYTPQLKLYEAEVGFRIF